eukprot:gnl/Dysnectes_brevis/175_a203_6621.p1 GENE.gnl/Dysnectes_brevis/175_a203_6621~~gnl/Dysnectes_brevis/175_a203_6621.p1  ORF type:complete len:510 (-),score=187.89 gnl/Dysnectes_brevis/175_a203_6621:42-1541(-)
MLQHSIQKELLKKFTSAKLVWEIFLRLTEIPRGSFNHEFIEVALNKMITDLGLTPIDIGNNNILVRVPATPGCEAVPGICLQAHHDMVCTAARGVEIDFKKDPLHPEIIEIDGVEWLTAKGTTLGADNGIGIALGLALLADKDLKHGPLELLLTADEEVGLIGAAQVEPNTLESKYLLNLDSEDPGICISCAGGFRVHWELEANERVPFEGTPLFAEISGVSGGHSGCDIHCGKASAIVTLGQVLRHVEEQGVEYRVASMAGGSAHNAIPKAAGATVWAKDPAAFTAAFNEGFEKHMAPFRTTDPKAICEITPATDAMVPVDAATTKKWVSFIIVAPIGPHRFSPDMDDLVETSFATTVMAMKENGNLDVMGSGRSSVEAELDACYRRCQALAHIAGAKVSPCLDRYPGWPPNPTSPFLAVLKKVHLKELGVPAEVTAIHAGLEAGMLVAKHPGMDAISVGPTICNPHSDLERLEIPTVEPTYRLCVKGIEVFCEMAHK